jgi:hypothetical protein
MFSMNLSFCTRRDISGQNSRIVPTTIRASNRVHYLRLRDMSIGFDRRKKTDSHGYRSFRWKSGTLSCLDKCGRELLLLWRLCRSTAAKGQEHYKFA